MPQSIEEQTAFNELYNRTVEPVIRKSPKHASIVTLLTILQSFEDDKKLSHDEAFTLLRVFDCALEQTPLLLECARAVQAFRKGCHEHARYKHEQEKQEALISLGLGAEEAQSILNIIKGA